jgi:hypothetical protein
VPVSRATAVEATGLDGEEEARAWLERCRSNEQERERMIGAALIAVNRAIQAHRLAAVDPETLEVGRAQVLRAVIGYGSGQQVADGRWRGAYVVAPPRARRSRQAMLAPHEGVAAILCRRRPVRASDDLVLRARLDLDNDRPAQAALQLAAALDAVEAELEAGEGDAHMSALAGRRAAVRRLAERALRAPLSTEEAEELEDALAEAVRVLRRRSARPD